MVGISSLVLDIGLENFRVWWVKGQRVKAICLGLNLTLPESSCYLYGPVQIIYSLGPQAPRL